uniref:Uncharacterized protein n=1 Tax=Ditylenchus dipsaci TaxID=166011 RepID=A0A915EBG2_9BILA
MPIFGSKEGTPSNGRPGMSAPPAPIRVHHNGGNRPSVPPSSAKIPSSTPLFASMFGISRHKKQNSAPLQTNTTNLPSEYYMDENSNGLQGSYTNGHQKSGTYTSAFHPVGKPPTAVASHSNNHSGLSNNHINRRQSIGGGVEEKQQSTSFFQRLTRRKTPVSISTPSSPASARKHFFSFGSSDNHNRSASNKPVVSKEDVPLANNTRPKSAIPNPQQQQLSFCAENQATQRDEDHRKSAFRVHAIFQKPRTTGSTKTSAKRCFEKGEGLFCRRPQPNGSGLFD